MLTATNQQGLTLIELIIATAISAIIMLALNDLVKLGLDAQTVVRGSNELTYQGRFALERIADKARNLAPKELTTAKTNTTGDWFAPAACTGSACVMYCLNTAKQLIETVTTDTTCMGTTVIANNVSAFSATLPANMGAADKSIAVLSMTLSDADNNNVSFSSAIRLGGGAL
jgi:prepilin-type N-terminal cleavage/methylation domain-containing protein